MKIGIIMTENIIITTIPIELTQARHYRDEAKRYTELALGYAKKAAECWVKFYDLTQKLYEDGAHLILNLTWKRYCTEYLGVTAARIRQLRKAMPLALAIESDCGILPNEWYLREAPNHLNDVDPQLASAIYQGAVKLADGIAPKKEHYKAAESVITELMNHDSLLDGTKFHAALVQEEFETMMRQKERIKAKSQFTTTARYDVTSGGLRQRLRKCSTCVRTRGLRVNAPKSSPHMLLLIREEK